MTEAAKATSLTPSLPPGMLREYDIRGVIGKDLTSDVAWSVGYAFGLAVREKNSQAQQVCVGYDGRHSSPELEEAVTAGLQEAGLNVLRVGLGPTPMLYYSTKRLEADAGVMITGSHNPPEYNGFKFLIGGKPFYGEAIQQLAAFAGQPAPKVAKGKARSVQIKQDYIDMLAAALHSGGRDLKVAWDAGNGAAGEVMAALTERLPGEHFLLYEEIDGNFPNHHPDPTVPENLEELIDTVKAEGCDVGLAFDGDGDRLGVVDGEGNILWGDQLLQIYAQDVLKDKPGSTIIADVKASQHLFDEIARLGGKPLMWKTGHSLIKAKMGETGAPLAGEMSGHLFFADNYGFDDGLYAGIRLLSILAHAPESLSQLFAKLPKAVNTPELRIPCEESEKFSIVTAVRDKLRKEGANFSEVDGVRVMTEDGWWLLRASNTQAVLVARCEGKDAGALERLKSSLTKALDGFSVAVP